MGERKKGPSEVMRRVGGLAALDQVLYEAQRSNRDDVSTMAVLSQL